MRVPEMFLSHCITFCVTLVFVRHCSTGSSESSLSRSASSESLDWSTSTESVSPEDEWHTLYHQYDEVIDFVKRAADRCDEDCTTEVIGKSVEDRDLLLIKIGQNSTKSIILIDATIHGLEWIAPATAQYLIDKLADPDSDDPLVRNMQQKHNFHILALLNPDGYEHTFEFVRLWRKSRRYQVDEESGEECYGVDLNRNFGYQWGGSSSYTHPCSEAYRGSAPFSEPESRAVRDYMVRVSPHTKAYITLHSYGQYWLFPWGFDQTVAHPANAKQLRRAAEAAAAAQESVNGREYEVGNSATLFGATTGASDDYAFSLGIPYAYTLELPPKDTFCPQAKFIIPVGRETIAGLAALVDNME